MHVSDGPACACGQGFRRASMKRGRRIACRLTDTTEMERHSSSVDLDQRTCPHWVKSRSAERCDLCPVFSKRPTLTTVVALLSLKTSNCNRRGSFLAFHNCNALSCSSVTRDTPATGSFGITRSVSRNSPSRACRIHLSPCRSAWPKMSPRSA